MLTVFSPEFMISLKLLKMPFKINQIILVTLDVRELNLQMLSIWSKLSGRREYPERKIFPLVVPLNEAPHTARVFIGLLLCQLAEELNKCKYFIITEGNRR